MTDQTNSHCGTRLIIIAATFVIIILGINQVPSVLDDVRPASERNAGIRQRDINPSDSSGKERQLQNVAPSIKNRKARFSQPKANQDEKEAGITKKQASTMFRRAVLSIYFSRLFNQSKR
jgi:hypothetical protein